MYLPQITTLNGTEKEVHWLVTTFVRSAILPADYFCELSYIFRDGHFSDVYLYCLVIALMSLLDELYWRMTAPNKAFKKILMPGEIKIMIL